MSQLDDIPLPTGIGKPATRALGTIGVTRLAQLAQFPANDLMTLHGFGPKALRILREHLREQGLALAGESPSANDA